MTTATKTTKGLFTLNFGIFILISALLFTQNEFVPSNAQAQTARVKNTISHTTSPSLSIPKGNTPFSITQINTY
jgi:hypothetical protein